MVTTYFDTGVLVKTYTRERHSALAQLKSDIQSGRLRRPAYDLTQVFAQAESLATSHATQICNRSLDILHVAAATELGCTTLCSFDKRQRTLAAHAQLEVLPHKLPAAP